jgi:hypothetical protein
VGVFPRMHKRNPNVTNYVDYLNTTNLRKVNEFEDIGLQITCLRKDYVWNMYQ